MKFEIDCVALTKAMTIVRSIVEQRSAMRGLGHVLMRAEDNAVCLTGTDLITEIAIRVPAQIKAPGVTAVPAHALHDILRRISSQDPLQFDLDGDLRLRAGRFQTLFRTMDVDDMAMVRIGALPCQFEIEAPVLRHLVDRTRFAISVDETRYYLNGLFLHVVPGGTRGMLRAVATDGHRLARSECPMPETSIPFLSSILPRKLVAELHRVLDGDTAETVTVSASQTAIAFNCGAIRLTSKLIDGTFPDYERVIPRRASSILRVPGRDFAAVVERVNAIVQDRTRPIVLDLRKDALTLANAADQGNAAEALDDGIVSYDGQSMRIGFQARFLKDVTDQVGGEMEIQLGREMDPAIILDVSDPDSMFVVMPIRV